MDRNSVTYAECERQFYLEARVGFCNTNFRTLLYHLIMKADSINTVLLAKGYPEIVDIVKRYLNEVGYWERLEENIGANYE